jgi:hypothetical protein
MNARKAEPLLARTLGCVESDAMSAAVAADFLERAALTQAEMIGSSEMRDQLPADPEVSNADIKGLLNRINAWQDDSLIGADAKALRKYFEAARDAIARWIGKE